MKQPLRVCACCGNVPVVGWRVNGRVRRWACAWCANTPLRLVRR